MGRWIVSRLGRNPAAALGLDPGDDGDAARWLVASCLLAGRVDEECALRAFRALTAAGLDAPADVAAATREDLTRALENARYPRPERSAALLARACATLLERHGGSPGALAAEAETFEDLATRLAQLAPGLGPAAVMRFLRPLRDVWPAALELPLTPAARAAAVHVGLLADGEDEEGEPAALRAALAREPDAPPLADVESALERLGRRACLRDRPDRCPLGADCPAG